MNVRTAAMSEKPSKDDYATVTIEAAVQGWIVYIPKQPAEFFVRWEAVVNRLAALLTTKGAN